MPYIGMQLIGESDLEHHGILGQKWGVRRFRNPDGTLTEEGKLRYGSHAERVPEKEFAQQLSDAYGAGTLKRAAEVDKKMIEAASKNADIQTAQEVTQQMLALQDALIEQYGPDTQLVLDGEAAKAVSDAYKAARDAYLNLAEDYLDEMSSLTLSDLGYEDTQAGREFVKQFYRSSLSSNYDGMILD